jgi:DNA-directed RNA polymerase specialized sigma24 family protein
MGTDAVEIYEKHADELIRFASVLVGPSGAEDVLAGAMLRVLGSSRS